MDNSDVFKPENKNISDIFSFTGIYTIPNYQRQYSWNDDNLEALWEDLYESFKGGTDKCYFLGSIVVVDRKNGEFELVDGQQRITTLMIMLNVLYKCFPDTNKNNDNIILKANKSSIAKLIYYDEGIDRLRLQQDPDYDSMFKNNITNILDYKIIKKPTKEELKKETPEYKYKNAAYFFYNEFSKLLNDEGQKVFDDFVNYIMFKTNIIKIICYDQSFAIKLFLVLNDRGAELSNSDIVKSIIYNAFDKDKRYTQYHKNVFNSNWKSIEEICKENDFQMDDFLVFFEYFKLMKNPKKQITDEIKDLMKEENFELNSFIAEMKSFADNVKKVYTEKNNVIYSLRYIPWHFYVITSLATAYQVDYPDTESLFKILRRFFYLSWIGGKTLNGIKQTSFNILEAIGKKKTIEEIKNITDDFILRNHLIKNTYEALDGDVYGENFLKPLMLSIDYKIRESLLTDFYQVDKNIHIDHVLPKKYYVKSQEWPYITDKNIALSYINKLGNMALLLGKKNEEALNHGFDKKINIYLGFDKNNTGRTAFDTTNWIINNYDKNDEMKNKWDIDCIENRQLKLMYEIEKLLEISRDDVEIEENYIMSNKNVNKYLRQEYNFEHHLSNCTEKVNMLFNELHNRILTLNRNITFRINKIYIGYWTTKPFVDIFFNKDSLQVYVWKVDNYYDPENRLEKVPESYRWSSDSRMEVKNIEDIDYAMNIIVQSYNNTL